MQIKLLQEKKVDSNENLIIIAKRDSKFSDFFNEKETKYILQKIEREEYSMLLNQYDRLVFIEVVDVEEEIYKLNEKLRKAAVSSGKVLNKNKKATVFLQAVDISASFLLPYAEGLLLSNYQFNKYFKEKEKKNNTLKKLKLVSEELDINQLNTLSVLAEAIYFARNLINEPVIYLTAEQLVKEIKEKQKEAGYKLTVFDKKKIEALKMGGLLAVNKGSIDPPSFSILEWQPENAKNDKPVVLVGKGIVFDTGGLSLKPTADSMDYMKSDMSGAAAVAGLMYAIAKAKLPVKVIGLIPSTDNRPDGNAYTPGDVIKMYDGTTVEVLNTDAEGRMILADALSYAKQYNPDLVVDIATLTGAAAYSIGKYGIVAMGNADPSYFEKLKNSGNKTYERIAEFPFWEEYKELLKSDIADLKNIGGRVGGAITAGKFLEHFTDYPYIHLDIAGAAFVKTEDSYRGKGGTGAGIRLLFDFIKNLY